MNESTAVHIETGYD